MSDESSPLTCRLRQKPPFDAYGRRRGPRSGEAEIENTSTETVEIEYQALPLEHLNLIVTDASGSLISNRHYGIIFAPMAESAMFRLAPGEKYIHNVDLLGNVPDEKHLPGIYTVRAVYEYGDIRAVSEPLDIVLPFLSD